MQRAPRKPGRLCPGDRVAVVSPASTPTREGVERGVAILESWGLQVTVGDHALDEHGQFLAGTDDERLHDLNQALRDPEIRAVFATRGGKGAYRLVRGLDFNAMEADPIPVVGFSEITFLHLAFLRHCNVAGIHGPMINWNFDYCDEASADLLHAALMDPTPVTLHRDRFVTTADINVPGVASGVLIGGCLDGVRSSFGWNLPNLDGTILFVEETGCDQIGRIDRSLTQLTHSGAIANVRGVVLGTFSDYEEGNGRTPLVDVLRPHFERVGVPVLGGIPVGHGVTHLPTIPIGTNATIDVEAGTVTIEPGVL